MQQVYAPPLTRINKTIIISLVIFFLINAILSKFFLIHLSAFFSLSLVGLKNFFLWQPLTYIFVSEGLMATVFNCLLIWFIGSEFENRWGRDRYLFLLLCAVVGGGVTYILASVLASNINIFLSGPSVIIHGLLLCYAICFPDQYFSFMFFFPIKAKYFCLFLIGILMFQAIFEIGGIRVFADLGAMALSYLSMIYLSKRGAEYNPLAFLNNIKNKKKKSHLRLINQEQEEEKKRDKDEKVKYWH